MNSADITLLLVFLGVLAAATPLLGAWIAATLEGRPPTFLRWLHPVERLLHRAAGVQPDAPQDWKAYAAALLTFNLLGGAVLLALQLLQHLLPLNPDAQPAVPLGIAFNTAVSFLTNTNWQAYSGEASLSHLTQMAGLGVQNFLSAATGLAVLAALARGIAGGPGTGLGSFWSDVIRSTLHVLLPLAFVLALALAAEGVVMNLSASTPVTTLEGADQRVPGGPAASQVAIKQLGTNGGGFFGVNSAHPLENPTPLSNLLQTLALLLIPAACVDAFGRLARARRHAGVLLAVMAAYLAVGLGVALRTELDTGDLPASAVWEGKETRIGPAGSVLWAVATTAASNGSVNAMHGSLSPGAGGVALLNMLLGEVVFGGVGSGLYGMVLVALVTIFLAGLLVGRTPEYLGKKLGAREVWWAAAGVLLPSAVVLLGCAASFLTEAGRGAAGTSGPHALTEILYAWASMANNNGSAFGSLNATGALYTWGGAAAMLVGRFGVILPVLAIAGGFASRRAAPPSSGTLPVDCPEFAVLLVGVLALVAGLTFLPALALGPVLEHLLLARGASF